MKAHYLAMTLHGIRLNNFQAFLAVLGVTVGVAALIVSLGLARGARQSIGDQMLAIGANMIVVTAGNYQVKRPQDSGIAPADHGVLMPDTSAMRGLAAMESPRLIGDLEKPETGGATFLLAH